MKKRAIFDKTMREAKKYGVNKKYHVKLKAGWKQSAVKILRKIHICGGVSFVHFDENKELFKYELLIARTILNLPKRVRNEVINKIAFVLSSNNVAGGYISNLEKKKIILLNTKTINKFCAKYAKANSDSYKMSVIAHEISHFILKHEKFEYHLTKYPYAEKEANELIKEWGFKPISNAFSEMKEND